MLHADDRALVVAERAPARGRWLVRFEGIDDRTAAEALLGARAHAARRCRREDDELWVHELIGARGARPRGPRPRPCVAVEANPASDLLVLDGDVLVPMTFVVEQGPGFVVVDPPEGLLDVNRRD